MSNPTEHTADELDIWLTLSEAVEHPEIRRKFPSITIQSLRWDARHRLTSGAAEARAIVRSPHRKQLYVNPANFIRWKEGGLLRGEMGSLRSDLEFRDGHVSRRAGA